MKFDRIQFETTNNCNMRCGFCPNRTMKRARTFLCFDIFKKTIDEISCNSLTNTISFAGNGEPLLDNKIGEKIKYCKLKGLKTVITTNGVLLERITPDILKNLDTLYTSWQTFNESSLDGTESEYEKGFMNTYGQTDFENDFNEYRAMIFTYPETFKQIMARHPRVRGKFLVWLKFYQEIDPIFTEEYLLGTGGDAN